MLTGWAMIWHRVWALIWGGILTFSFSMIPSFRHFRIMSFIGIIGTAFTALFIISSAATQGLQVQFDVDEFGHWRGSWLFRPIKSTAGRCHGADLVMALRREKPSTLAQRTS